MQDQSNQPHSRVWGQWHWVLWQLSLSDLFTCYSHSDPFVRTKEWWKGQLPWSFVDSWALHYSWGRLLAMGDGLVNMLVCVWNSPILFLQVTLYFNNKLYRGNRTTKTNSAAFDAFSSPNMTPLATVGVNIQGTGSSWWIRPGNLTWYLS